jgi:hypothetical protein
MSANLPDGYIFQLSAKTEKTVNELRFPVCIVDLFTKTTESSEFTLGFRLKKAEKTRFRP